MAHNFKRNATRVIAVGSVVGLGAAVAGAQVLGSENQANADAIDLGGDITTTSTTVDVPTTDASSVSSTTLSDDGLDRVDDSVDDSVDASPESVDDSPDSVDVSPDTVDDSPDSVDVSPDTVDDSPDSVDVSPDSVDDSPDSDNSDDSD